MLQLQFQAKTQKVKYLQIDHWGVTVGSHLRGSFKA